MLKASLLSTFLMLGVFWGCSVEKKSAAPVSPNNLFYSKGSKVTDGHFSGKVWLNRLGAQDSTLHVNYGTVTFEPRARTHWHLHPGGQLLFVIRGSGYYQTKGQPPLRLRKGDVVEIPPDIVHWHGAGTDSELVHLAVSLSTEKGKTVWLEPVTDKEYDEARRQADSVTN